MSLLADIKRYLRNTGVAPTTFGRLTVGDSRFVIDLEAGRQPRPEREKQLREWMEKHPRGPQSARARR
jgi:hypothetical protein